MKKLLLIAFIVILALGGASAFAEPFLCSNPYTIDMVRPTHFEITVNGGEPMDEDPQVAGDWSRLHMDLADFPDGEYTIEVIVCNMWGCSSPTPFFFIKAVPSELENIFIGN